MAFFMKEEFPDVAMDKVIKMCIIYDLGEAFTGDIPVFEKTSANEEKEEVQMIRLSFRVFESMKRRGSQGYAREAWKVMQKMGER